MEHSSWDLVVLGSGPAGEAAAMRAAKGGKRVVMVEPYAMVGGSCTHLGTVPSKALRHQVRQLVRYNRNPLLDGIMEAPRIKWSDLIGRIRHVTESQALVRKGFYVRNRVHVLQGKGYITSKNEVRVKEVAGQKHLLATKNIIIATGSSPYHPEDVDFSSERVYDSDTILNMTHTPRHIVIYGAGVIGCEYASIFAGLGMRVDLINTRHHLLDFLDTEITDALSYHLRDQGVTIRHGEEYQAIETTEHQVVVALKSGKRIRADALLWANGRSGNTDELGLENVGLEADGRGQLQVNDQYRTEVESIYAVGDVIGWPSLASAAYDQGRFCSAQLCGEAVQQVTEVPTGIYTIPGISSVGRTEQELTADKIPYEVGQAFFKNLARAQISNERAGMLKILFHQETRELLGIHCFGYQSTEIIHVGQAIMKQPAPNNTIDYFVETTFNYPTMAEAYRVAAINGLNRLV